MQKLYSKKQENPQFNTLNLDQVLKDLELITNDKKITYSCLFLVGKKEALEKYIPQAKITLEFRTTTEQIRYDDRKIFQGPVLHDY